MKKFILSILMISSFFVLGDFTFINSEQKAGKGGKSVFGKSQGGSINNNNYKNNKSTNVNTSASVLKK